ncbi:MAG: CocE/NonD family hydrolase [Gemmatimonadetes bacterium]|nr:CocE/NonD family hydrolase [Gemmatimonadota bacterium]
MTWDTSLIFRYRLPTNPAEKRNAILGKMRDFIADLAENHAVFPLCEIKYTRFAWHDLAALVTCLEVNGGPADIKAPALRRMYENGKKFKPSSKAGKHVKKTLNYLRMVSHGHPHQKLVLGPWGHTDQAQRMIGDRDFGSEAIIDLSRLYLRWFDHWLKGVDNGIADEPLVSIFVMGRNEWLYGDTYPLPNTEFKKLYLTSGGKANTSKGDGRLVQNLPPANTPVDRPKTSLWSMSPPRTPASGGAALLNE